VGQPRTTTSYAVLGLLALRSWTTYELAKQVQRSLGWFWPRAERKLYEEPKRLVEAGLATGAREMTGARPRTIYGATAKGRKELGRWLGEAPAPPSLEFEGLVKVFFADAGTLEQLDENLRSIAATSDARVRDLEAKVEEHNAGDVPFPQRLPINTLGLRFQLDHERVIGTWARWSLEQTKHWRSPTDPGSWDYHEVFGSGSSRSANSST
jgi:PadR family transcriptional regulator AphA